MPSKSTTENPNALSEKQPKNLDRLIIPGMSQGVSGYDGGVPAWLLASGLTVQVDKNWAAVEGDIITVADISDPSNTKPLAIKKLQPGEQEQNRYFLTLHKADLPDGDIQLGYAVYYGGGKEYDVSSPLHVLIKTDIPAGDDSGFPPEGHPALKFSLSTYEVFPPTAPLGVTATIEPYPNMHADDKLHLNWGQTRITQQVAGIGQPTEITVSHEQIIDAGDGYDLLVDFYVVDVVGNRSHRRSKYLKVLVSLDESTPDGPGIITDDPVGYIDLERLAGTDLKTGLFTDRNTGLVGDMYDFTFRAYPQLGGVIVYRAFEPVVQRGVPVNIYVPYGVVRAAAGGRIETRFILRKLQAPFEVPSKKTSAQVVGSIVRLDAPYFENYPDHVIDPIPDFAVMVVPWYEWRRPDDEITIIVRFVKSSNDTIVFAEPRVVGSSWPAGSPVKRLIYRKDLEQFAGYTPEVYYVYRASGVLASSADLNESLRQVVRIG
ncbi:hypothetical protein AU074_03340 [Pseudomonas sp. ATCC PTA-122608]|uniref:hypothetical protein n=1 Tax=Pseudomonas sp. ATCC PTA-122608 TaxID=1771311 RepID=UPI00096B6E38|nr:hypothetical protein [Pseudomonas sp. ATCC PTA-122608]OLY76817.1 hypothetical protein AU074_03340 [Pseudomonas sp. ATCC PTA-122608]